MDKIISKRISLDVSHLIHLQAISPNTQPGNSSITQCLTQNFKQQTSKTRPWLSSVCLHYEKYQDYWTREVIYEMSHILNCVQHMRHFIYHLTSILRSIFCVQYMRHFMYHFTSILHGLIRTHKWPAPNVSGFIAQ